jgi:hypothetical protein
VPESARDFQRLRANGKIMNWALMVAALGALSIWWFVFRLPGNVEISKMSAGLDTGMTALECWLTLDFKEAPSGDLNDLVVEFEGEALIGGKQSFDWEWIASHDMTAVGKRTRNDKTTPDGLPPIGEATQAKFPLRARIYVDDASFNMPLVATVYWAGKKQDKMQRSVGHAYSHGG